MTDVFAGLPRKYFGAILADPPWSYKTWTDSKILANVSHSRVAERYYGTMDADDIQALPVDELAADNCVLFLWATWPCLIEAFQTITAWGFAYKTCAFNWTKANASQIDMFRDDLTPAMKCGFWTRANTEPCLLATRGSPKRLDAGVRQAIVEPAREHSRKPDCVQGRIERLVAGPYLELFARQSRPGWTTWGNESTKFDKPYDAADDFAKSLDVGYAAIRERVAAGGKPWEPGASMLTSEQPQQSDVRGVAMGAGQANTAPALGTASAAALPRARE